MARNGNNLSGILSGVSGEYFVAAELSRMGYIASITLRNTRGVDILASNADASRTVAIQVKTNQGSRRHWLMHQKAEDYFADNLFYVLVNLNGGGQPEFFVVPSTDMARLVGEQYRRWYQERGREPPPDNTMRAFWDGEGEYLDKWDTLGLDVA